MSTSIALGAENIELVHDVVGKALNEDFGQVSARFETFSQTRGRYNDVSQVRK